VRRRSARTGTRLAVLATAAAILGVAACSASPSSGGSALTAQERAAAANPNLDTGSSLNGVAAPNFRLTNQFGQPVSLSAFRGKVVILAFTDSECTTICPLTTASMVAARNLLGRAGDRVQLLGIDANPSATARSDVLAYSRSHGMVNQWDFLTGSLAQLHAVWKAYHVYVQIVKGDVDHTPALYVIDPRGRERELYLTTMAYTSVAQSGQVLAAEASKLLPGHPALARRQSLAFVGGISPRTTLTAPPVTVPSVAGGPVRLGPGRARMVMFFATWLSETSDLRDELTGLNQSVTTARREHLPGLEALDEAVTEPSPGAARAYLARLRTPRRYPVGLDTTGRIADGYGVQDQPWFVLVSASGHVLWKHDGWLSATALAAAARRAR
jgi:cytochrome oxidase Cu insertion factor (SCO1/SenC/PrrC family)